MLQHMRPQYQSAYLREFIRVLRPGGIAVPHVPVVHTDGKVRDYNSIETEGETKVEMYGQPIETVERVLRDAGGEVLHSIKDQWSGPTWQSAHYVVRKP
ncbi:MAG: hypothetical protein AB7O97_24285 [Planctomycetota bacterium]